MLVEFIRRGISVIVKRTWNLIFGRKMVRLEERGNERLRLTKSLTESQLPMHPKLSFKAAT